MPDRVFCRRHDPDGHANWDSGFRPLLDDTCYMCAAEQLEQQLQQVREEARKEVAQVTAERIKILVASRHLVTLLDVINDIERYGLEGGDGANQNNL